MDSFYVFLPSNTPYPENKTSDYLVKLPNIIDLSDGNWTVALSSFIYPISFSGLEDEQKLTVHYTDNTTKTIIIPKTITYNSVDALEKSINNVIKSSISDAIKKRSSRAVSTFDNDKIEANNILNDSEQVFNNFNELKTHYHEMKHKVLNPETIEVKSDAENIRINIINEINALNDLYKQASTLISSIRSKKTVIDFGSNGMQGAKSTLDRMRRSYKSLFNLHSTAYTKATKLKDQHYPEFLDSISGFSMADRPRENSSNEHSRIKNIINNTIKPNQDIYFYYDNVIQRFYLYTNNIAKVDITPQLAYILGFEIELGSSVSSNEVNTFAKYSPDISGGLHLFYIYAPNLIENTIIGDKYAPLLRVVNADKNTKNSVVESIYTKEYHHRVLLKQIDEIRIRILSDTGRPIAFNWGNCITTLHFQRSFY